MTDEFDKLCGQAVALHQQGKMAEAVQAYVQLFTKAPRHSDIYNNLGVALRSLDKLEAAVACHKRALVYGLDAGNVYSNLGNSLRELARFDEAEIAHKRAVELSEERTSDI
jgi:Flp pilus assembly protein TadD